MGRGRGEPTPQGTTGGRGSRPQPQWGGAGGNPHHREPQRGGGIPWGGGGRGGLAALHHIWGLKFGSREDAGNTSSDVEREKEDSLPRGAYKVPLGA